METDAHAPMSMPIAQCTLRRQEGGRALGFHVETARGTGHFPAMMMRLAQEGKVELCAKLVGNELHKLFFQQIVAVPTVRQDPQEKS